MGCHWEREERNGHGDPEEAVWCILVQGCRNSWSGRRTSSRPCTLGRLDAAPWQVFILRGCSSRSELILLMFSAQSREQPSSLQEAFSPSYPEPAWCRRVRRSPHAGDQQAPLRRASLTPGVRRRRRSCTWSAQPRTKALSPLLKEECKTKETARGRQKTPLSAGVRSFGNLYMKSLSRMAFSGKRKQPL